MTDGLMLAGLSWDPFVRGLVIFVAAVIILPGSVFMLLSTNLGARLGFVLAVTGLSGWLVGLGALWTVFGIGPVGESPSWVIQDVVTGDLDRSTVEAAHRFPRDWKKLEEGDAQLADAETAALSVLAAGGGGGGGEGGGEGGGGGG
ncbi:MAG TPA: hypothetical protein VHE80_04765, partial [Acidimicrobiales bacterium]|nr:hypothetical protein [Acidimicrobiales bacterium]